MSESLISQLKTLNQEFKHDLYQGPYLITEYCEKLRYEVFAATESAVEHLNKLNDSLIKAIDNYEKELLESFEMRSKSFDEKRLEWQQLIDECEEMINDCETTKMDERTINEPTCESLYSLINDLKNASEWAKDKLIFNENYFNFVELEAFYDTTNSFGMLLKTNTRNVRKSNTAPI